MKKLTEGGNISRKTCKMKVNIGEKVMEQTHNEFTMFQALL